MDAQERPNLRYPLLRWGGWEGLVLVAIVLIGGVVATDGKMLFASAIIENTILLGAYLAATVYALSNALRFRGAHLVLDHEGVAILRGGRRHGLTWDEFEGFEWKTRKASTVLELRSRNGQTLALPVPTKTEDQEAAINHALNLHLTRQGHPLTEKIPDTEIARRLTSHPGNLPPVEMEPGVLYRYADADKIAAYIRSTGIFSMAACLVAPLLLNNIFRLLPYRAALSGITFTLFLAILIYQVITHRQLLRSLRDRFVRRGDTLYVVRQGTESALPAGTESASRLMRQPLWRHGSGLFPYRMAPQFLEPDPDANR